MHIESSAWPKFRKNPASLMADESSAELLDRYRRNEPGAADRLFTRYVESLSEMVRHQIAPSLRRRLDPEDAVHSAYRSFFIRARAGQFTLQNSGDLWRLLVTITLNKLRRQIAHHQAAKRTVRRDRPLSSFAGHADDGPTPLQALATVDELESFMRSLTPLQRRVLELRLQDDTWEQIATATGRSERTVRRAIEEIRKRWVDDPDAVPIDFQPLKNVKPPAKPANQMDDPRAPFDYRDYKLEQFLGSGGMGKVYRATHKQSGQTVAVKMLHRSRWSDPAAAERFLDEAHLFTRLNHPGIVQVYGFGRTPGGGLFIVREFVDGNTLESQSTVDAKTAARWISEAARAIAHAHRNHVIHCDLKPANLLLDRNGTIRVCDFGLAVLQQSSASKGSTGGTLGYMAPEQLDPAFGPVGPWTDVFALGLVLLRLLSGVTVFEGRRALHAMTCQHDDVQFWWMGAERVDDHLESMLRDCLALDREARIQSADGLADNLDRWVAREG